MRGNVSWKQEQQYHQPRKSLRDSDWCSAKRKAGLCEVFTLLVLSLVLLYLFLVYVLVDEPEQ